MWSEKALERLMAAGVGVAKSVVRLKLINQTQFLKYGKGTSFRVGERIIGVIYALFPITACEVNS
jgi:hypothetical protein